MRAHGNGLPAVCAQNLLLMHAGECPMDRLRGRDSRLIESRAGKNRIISDAREVLLFWEPRVDCTLAEIEAEPTGDGDYRLTVTVEDRKAEL